MKSRIYCKTDGCRRYANINEDGICPRCLQNDQGQVDEVETPGICGICNNEIDDHVTNSIGCDGCDKWFHPKCAGPSALLELIPQAGTEAAANLKGMLLWYCPQCVAGPTQGLCFGFRVPWDLPGPCSIQFG